MKIKTIELPIVIVEDEISGGYTVHFRQWDSVIAEGDTEEEAITNLFNAMSDILNCRI